MGNNRITKENLKREYKSPNRRRSWNAVTEPTKVKFSLTLDHKTPAQQEKANLFMFSNLCEPSDGSRDVAPDVILSFFLKLITHVTLSKQNDAKKNKTKKNIPIIYI